MASQESSAAPQGGGATAGRVTREITAVVISDKMQKSVVVKVERQVRHGVYGKTQRRTTTFMAHDEAGTAKVGDTVAIVESRPLSRRKRWTVTRIVAKTQQI
jgi:small subunit ribosomal protein S17